RPDDRDRLARHAGVPALGGDPRHPHPWRSRPPLWRPDRRGHLPGRPRSVLRSESAVLLLLDRRAPRPGLAGPARRDPGRLRLTRQIWAARRRAGPDRAGSRALVSMLALATRGLDKRFGSLVVARGVELSVPRGARHALIGPNGAGKTTLINMITGMLEPDGGQVFLGDQDVTRLAPDQRVKRGLARTFQINTLFPRLSPLEATTLAVCERRGLAASWWRSLGGCRAEMDEAFEILRSLGLATECRRATRELPYGQQRL